MRILLSLFVLLGCSSVFAASLPEGKFLVSEEYSLATATSVWVGKTLTDYTNSGRTFFQNFTTTAAFGLKYGFEVDVQATLGTSKMQTGMFSNHVAGDSETYLSQMGFRLVKQVLRHSDYDLTLNVGVRAPGDTSRSGDDFLAISDNVTKYDFGFKQVFIFGPHVSLFQDFRYTYRDDHPDLFLTNVGFSLAFGAEYQINPFVTYSHCFSGLDISDPAFASPTAPPFSQISEIFWGGGLSIAKGFSTGMWIYLFGFDKFTGENTDKSLSSGLGLAYIF
jgi:hypothetical protein